MTTADGGDAAHLIRRMHPDILLAALALPGMDGFDLTRYAQRFTPITRIALLSSHENGAYALETFRRGASAYLLLDHIERDVLHAIRVMLKGKRFVSAPLSLAAIEAELENCSIDTTIATLTPREREVLELVISGEKNSEIAQRLGISTRTVETHRANLMRKFGVANVVQLVLAAVRGQ